MTLPGLRSVVERSWRENLLFSVLLELTYRCDLDCAFCYNDLSLKGKPLSLAQYQAFLEELRDLQVLNLTLSGGEPLRYPGFFEIATSARRLGFLVRVKTNGTALDRELAERLHADVDPFQIEVSLHGATGATHDRLTRIEGSFDRLVSNLRAIAPVGLRIRLHSVLTAWNEHELEAMFALADELGLPLRVDPDVTPRDDGDRSPLSMTASREGVARLFRLETERGAAAAAREPVRPVASPPAAKPHAPPPSSGKYCGAGSGGIAVDPYGNVYPCVQWRRPCGNLHERSIREIWADSRGLREVRELQPLILRTMQAIGPEANLMSFCPGTAEAVTGDPMKTYPAALRRAELLRGIKEAPDTVEAPGR